ncbi:3-hydroxyacyl-CoA dehydrogenase [Georgfuchsia toluolica]|uniref:3-hydroxyacyl-CoA dehydrogenase n=1 Tax=Georgfuchsia toluolica TaxID=424218 RepID=A0A916J2L5_9PROT|nr:3-hydroxyacyl-CoA dehydrogenase/enoyl-CoA hydratase family protein [Georgfuchsia toluolica]CAG4882825.1 3-hydroxyacyl-CoA dehydrogenase [Georgfuchsia toluolica]
MTTGYLNPLLVSPPRPLPRVVAVIGAGTIGPDIGYYLKSALPGIRLYLVDISQTAVDRAIQRFHDYAAKAVAKGKMSAEEAKATTSNLVGTLDYNDIAEADWVLEAATENIDLKRKIFAAIEAVVGPDALITSNTSSLPAAEIFSKLKHPGRATVTHFFAPAWRNPVVEVIRWRRAAPATVEYLRWFFCSTGKVPLVTDDVPCFMLDRIFDNWCNESALLLDKATAAEIDSVANEFVHAGPFFVLNLANGNPIIVETNTLQAETEGEHYRPASIFGSVDRWITVSPGKSVPVAAAKSSAVRERLMGILFSQSVDILDRCIGEPADLDFGCRQALGFKRGPLDLMRDLGEKVTGLALMRLRTERAGMPMPKRPFAAYQNFLRHILVDDLDGVKVITLRRPEALNALHDEMTDEILSVIRRFEKDSRVIGFVLVGYGNRAFCAGADIGRFVDMLGDGPASTQYARDCSRLLVHLDRMKKPVVAALNGMALGGGFELAMRCHGIVALRSAWMQMPEITLGIVHGIGAMVVPYRRWPKASAEFHDMLRQAKRLKADRAFELGVIDDLAEDYPDLIRTAIARVKSLTGGVVGIPDGPVAIAELDPIAPVSASGQPLSAEVIRILENAIRTAAVAPTFAEALEVGYLAWGDSACTAAAREGITAFKDKRKPDFSKVA